jgi:hypothetical protein
VGRREGYDTILNTDLAVEQENFGRFLSLVVEHKHKIGFAGTILIEPKPHEPTKHQYDFDTQTVYGFLKRFGLENEVKVNIEANHATLSGHTFEHEIAMARALGIFGSIDANRGDPQNGWDTDQFPNSVEELTLACIEIERAGGFTDGGFNFDAKVRRQSIDAADLFHGHIGGVDVIARPCCAPRRSSPMAASMPSAPNATPDGMANWGRRSRARALPKSPISLWRAIWPQAGFGPAGMAGEHAQPLLTAIVGRVIGWGEVMMPPAFLGRRSRCSPPARAGGGARGAAVGAPFHPATAGSAAPDADGFIRRWLLLEPIAKPNRTNQLFTSAYVRAAFAADRPAGLGTGSGHTAARWPDHRAQGRFAHLARDATPWDVKLFGFAQAYGKPTYGVIFWAVTVIDAPRDMPDAHLAAGSNSASVWWLNGAETAALFGDRRMVMDDVVSPAVGLKKGRNVLVGAVINGPGLSDFCVRFVDGKGQPIRDLAVRAQ